MRHTAATLAPACALMLALVACTPAGAPPVDPLPNVESCGAEGLQQLLGQPEAVLATLRFSTVLRVIRPGMAVTMDYSPSRLNIEIDATGRISRISCG